ncbi:MAG: neocarzinostatin apoprotein domain-containing protein [Acidimicrobiales bacterium]
MTTTATVDDQGRAAAKRVRLASGTVDTEAALVRTLDATRSTRSRLVVARRPVTIAAAIVLVVSLLGAGTWALASRNDSARPLRTTNSPVDPKSYGPLLGTLRSELNPSLRADVYGTRELHDGSEVAVAITGGRPGRLYQATECTAATFNPAGDCASVRNGLTLDGDGAGTLVVTVWRVFSSSGFAIVNDCLVSSCGLHILPVGDETMAKSPGPDEHFGDAAEPNATSLVRPGSQVPLAFSSQGEVVIPAFAVTTLTRTPDRLHVRLTGHDLIPGTTTVSIDGTTRPRTGPMTDGAGEASMALTTVTVASDGTLNVDIGLPLVIEDQGSYTKIDGVVQPPAVVRCDAVGSSCRIHVTHGGPGEDPPVTHLHAVPQPYPKE